MPRAMRHGCPAADAAPIVAMPQRPVQMPPRDFCFAMLPPPLFFCRFFAIFFLSPLLLTPFLSLPPFRLADYRLLLIADFRYFFLRADIAAAFATPLMLY